MLDLFEEEKNRISEILFSPYYNNLKIPKYIETYLYWNYSFYYKRGVFTHGYYLCACGAMIPTPGYGMFVLVTNDYQVPKKEILENNYGIICDKCKKPTDFLFPLEYIDLSKKIIVMTLLYDSSDEYLEYSINEYSEATKKLRNNGYKCYVVRGREGLLQKITTKNDIIKSKIVEEIKTDETMDIDLEGVDFYEILRFEISPSKSLALSEKEDLFWVSEFLNTDDFKGFTKKGLDSINKI